MAIHNLIRAKQLLWGRWGLCDTKEDTSTVSSPIANNLVNQQLREMSIICEWLDS